MCGLLNERKYVSKLCELKAGSSLMHVLIVVLLLLPISRRACRHLVTPGSRTLLP